MTPREQEALEPRTSGTKVALGPTFGARVLPFVRLGAPVLSLVLLPVFALFVLGPPWWIALPLAWLLGWAFLSLVVCAAIGVTHRTSWWDSEKGTVQRGSTRFRTAAILGIEPDFRTQGSTLIFYSEDSAQPASASPPEMTALNPRNELAQPASAPDMTEPGTSNELAQSASAPNSHSEHVQPRHLTIPASGWDSRSYEGIARLQRHLGDTAAASRPELLARDSLAREYWANRELAQRYSMPWRSEYQDPKVFLEAFDALRHDLRRTRR